MGSSIAGFRQESSRVADVTATLTGSARHPSHSHTRGTTDADSHGPAGLTQPPAPSAALAGSRCPGCNGKGSTLLQQVDGPCHLCGGSGRYSVDPTRCAACTQPLPGATPECTPMLCATCRQVLRALRGVRP